MRNIPKAEVEVYRGTESRKILVEEGEFLMMNALVREGYYLSAPCGGKGRCGKCGVQVLEGDAWITSEDEKVFTKEQLKAGWRLSCKLYPTEDLRIAFALDDESLFEILSDCQNTETSGTAEESSYEIAVDIGTTTIAMELLGKDSGKNLHTVTCINEQRVYGADVISRIQASVDGRKEEIQNRIRHNLRREIRKLAEESGVELEKK